MAALPPDTRLRPQYFNSFQATAAIIADLALDETGAPSWFTAAIVHDHPVDPNKVLEVAAGVTYRVYLKNKTVDIAADDYIVMDRVTGDFEVLSASDYALKYEPYVGGELADLAEGATLADTIAKVNALLAELRTMHILTVNPV